MYRFAQRGQALHLWEDKVGDSGLAPTDEELHLFALAVEEQVRAQIAEDIEAKAEIVDAWSAAGAMRAAARIARGEL